MTSVAKNSRYGSIVFSYASSDFVSSFSMNFARTYGLSIKSCWLCRSSSWIWRACVVRETAPVILTDAGSEGASRTFRGVTKATQSLFRAERPVALVAADDELDSRLRLQSGDQFAGPLRPRP